jgi:hypothetical protein
MPGAGTAISQAALRGRPGAARVGCPPGMRGWLVAVSDDDPVTGRRFLTGSAYADDRHIRSRMAIYTYVETAADPRWRTSAIAWDGTQVVADVGCGNGFDLRQIVPQGRCRHAIGLDREFSSVTLRTHELALSIPGAQPVIAYVDSIREPTLALIGEPLDFDAVLGDITMKVQQVIDAQGSFRATGQSGVFVCR